MRVERPSTEPSRPKTLRTEITPAELLEALRRRDFQADATTTRITIHARADVARDEARAVRRELLGVPGVFDADADLEQHAAFVTHLPEEIVVEAVRGAVELAGFEPGPILSNGPADLDAAVRARYEALTRQWSFEALDELWAKACRMAVAALDAAFRSGALSSSDTAARRAAIGSERELVARQLRELAGGRSAVRVAWHNGGGATKPAPASSR